MRNTLALYIEHCTGMHRICLFRFPQYNCNVITSASNTHSRTNAHRQTGRIHSHLSHKYIRVCIHVHVYTPCLCVCTANISYLFGENCINKFSYSTSEFGKFNDFICPTKYTLFTIFTSKYEQMAGGAPIPNTNTHARRKRPFDSCSTVYTLRCCRVCVVVATAYHCIEQLNCGSTQWSLRRNVRIRASDSRRWTPIGRWLKRRTIGGWHFGQ